MSEAVLTKKALAASLKALTATTPLSRVTVADIVQNCGLNRQTFYYHFRDKYDLVHWIYQVEAMAAIEDCRDLKNWTEGIRRVLGHLVQNRVFYSEALRDSGSSTFEKYLFDVTRELILHVVHEVAEGMAVRDADQVFVAEFYAHAFVGTTLGWLEDPLREAPETLAERIQDIVEGSLQRALSRYAGLW